jgi:hypothetical protein
MLFIVDIDTSFYLECTLNLLAMLGKHSKLALDLLGNTENSHFIGTGPESAQGLDCT